MNEEILKVQQRGIINWGKPISTILEEGDNFIKLVKFDEGTDLLSVLFEGQNDFQYVYVVIDLQITDTMKECHAVFCNFDLLLSFLL